MVPSEESFGELGKSSISFFLLLLSTIKEEGDKKIKEALLDLSFSYLWVGRGEGFLVPWA